MKKWLFVSSFLTVVLLLVVASPVFADVWHSPSSHQNPTGNWSSPTKAYDINLSTYATGVFNNSSLTLILSEPIYCAEIALYTDRASPIPPLHSNMSISLEVAYTSGWREVYNGSINNTWWANISIPAGVISTIRVEGLNLGGNFAFRLFEVRLWQADTPAATIFDYLPYILAFVAIFMFIMVLALTKNPLIAVGIAIAVGLLSLLAIWMINAFQQGGMLW